MPMRKEDAHRAVELLEEYRRRLQGTQNEQLREALTKAIVAIRSRLFQALLDIHEFYTVTLESDSKSTESKTEETLRLAQTWEDHPPPLPNSAKEMAKRTVEELTDASEKGVAATTQNHAQDEDWITDTIELQRSETSGLGISIAGGEDNPHVASNPGIFITKLIPDSPADRDGRLQLGDQIVSVNGINLECSPHLHAVNTLKESGTNVTIVVRRRQDRVWTPVYSQFGTLDRVFDAQASPTQPNLPHSVDVVLIKNAKGLGFSIAGGRGNQHVLGDDGIFITKIIPEGPAEEDATLSTGDRILQVNGQSMVDVTHEEAVGILKSTQDRVVLRVEKNAIGLMGAAEGQDDVPDTVGNVPLGERSVVLNRPEGVGLGFHIIGGEGDTGIFVSFIAVGSIAEQCGNLHTGDQILEVNGRDVREASHEEAAMFLKGAGTVVTLLVTYKHAEFALFKERLHRSQDAVSDTAVPAPPSPEVTSPAPAKQLYVRAVFDYDCTRDDDRPSQGLSFKHGDILHVLNGSDEEWWQAALVGNHAEDGSQGLIPSKKRVERRQRSTQKSVKFTRTEIQQEKERRLSASDKRGARTSFKLSKKIPFLKKKEQAADSSEAEDSKVEEEHVPSYEPVSLEPRGYARPVIILGPMKEDINDMLVQEFPDKFAGCVPHTTRQAREGEVDGRDYHFVLSVEQMERDIQAHLFIEAGRYKDNLYGTSIKAVQEVANQGKHCILGVSGYAIRRLQMADLHPIAVCLKPASADAIREAQPKNSEDICKQIFDKGQRIQQEFAEYFTAVVEGDSLADIYNRVKNVIHEQSGNYIWVPCSESL